MSETTRCQATTRAGTQCKLTAQEGSQFCHLHQKEAAAPAPEPAAPADDAFARRRADLMAELDELVGQLQATMPQKDVSPYSPLHFARFLRDNFDQMRPELQLGILENFRDLTLEDMKDIDTWKGLAYMMSYSARFQAGQLKEKMNQQLPKPLQPDTVIEFVRKNVDRFTPEVAKNILASFEDATREDLMDPDTWKGVWYMLNYSVQFQANQLKERVFGSEEAQTETGTDSV